MTDFIEIQWTSGSMDEARKVCRYLVQEQLVACAQIIPWIESIYLWNQQLETAQESKITLKTRLQHLDVVKQVILDNCKYEIPEITYHAIEGGHQEYLDWVEKTTKTT